MSILTKKIKKILLITRAWVDEENLHVQFSDGNIIYIPIKLYPNLSKGTTDQLNNFEINGNGRWLHWEELDEDLSADGFTRLIK